MAFDESAALNFLEGNKEEPEFSESAASDFLDKKESEKVIDKPDPSPSVFESAMQWGAGFNDNLLNTLDIPNDVFNWAASKLGSDYRIPSTRDLGSQLMIGYREGEEPDTGSYRSGKFTSMGLEFLAPILAAGRTAKTVVEAPAMIDGIKTGAKQISSSKTPAVIKGAAETIRKPFINSPINAYTGEIAGGVLSGYGSYYGEQEFGPIGEQVGGLVGGMAGQVRMPFAQKLYGKLQEKVFPYTKTGAKQRAGNIIRASSETPDVVGAIRRNEAKVLKGANITPARMTDDPDLMALEKVLVDEDPELSRQFREIEQQNNVLARKVLEGMKGEEGVQEAKVFLSGKYAKLTTRLNAILDKRIVEAQDAIQGMTPKMKREAANTMIRDSIDKALSVARIDEDDLWRAVKTDEIAEVAPIRTVLRNLLDERYRADDPTEIPGYIQKFLGRYTDDGNFKFGDYADTESVGELHAFRKRLLKDMRKEKKIEAPDWNKVRIMDDIQEATLDSLDKSGSSDEIRDAINFSRELNKRFKGGVMNTILGSDANGGMLAPTLTMESVGPGPRGAEDIRRILNAAPDASNSVEQVLKAEMLYKLVDPNKGRLNLRSARQYLSRNEEVLDQFPAMRDDLNNAVGLEERAQWYTGEAKSRLQKAQKSVSHKIVKAKPKRIITTILESDKPELEMVRQLGRLNAKGRSGIKSDIIDTIYNKSKTSNVTDDGFHVLSGDKMYAYWTENKKMFSRAMTAKESRRIERIINTVRLSEGRQNLPVDRAKEQLKPTSGMIEVIARIAAAKGAAQSGIAGGSAGAGLQTAQIASSRAKRLIGELDIGRAKQLLKDAIFDEELYIALAEDTTKMAPKDKSWRIIQGWMVANAVEEMQDVTEYYEQ